MSRHDVVLYNGHELSYGWDRGLASYFVQIHDAEGELVSDVGCDLAVNENGKLSEVSPRTLNELFLLLEAAGMKPLSREQEAQLLADKKEEGMRITPFQEEMNRMVAELMEIERRPRDE